MVVWTLVACHDPLPRQRERGSCEALEACATAVDSPLLPQIRTQYGPRGTCWAEPDLHDLCEAACSAGSEALQPDAPFEPSCFASPWCDADRSFALHLGVVDLSLCPGVTGGSGSALQIQDEVDVPAVLVCDDLEHGTLTLGSDTGSIDLPCAAVGDEVICDVPEAELTLTATGSGLEGTMVEPFLPGCVFSFPVSASW